MRHILEQQASDHPDNPAVIGPEHSISYKTFFQQASNWAAYLKTQGPTRGQIIALDHLTPLETILAIWACSLCEAIAFPVNQRFPPSKRATILHGVNPVLVLGRDGLTGYRTIAPEVLNAYEQGSQEPSSVMDESLPATLLMTSGSAGAPKFVLHTLANHIASAQGSLTNIALESGDRWALELPLYHIGGLAIVFRTAIAGVAMVLPDKMKDPLANIIQNRVTHMSLVGTQFKRLLNAMDQAGASLNVKAILLGGSAIPGDLVHRGLDLGLPIHVSYGSTEMASQVTTSTALDKASRGPFSSGRALPHRDILISHEGEILLSGDTLGLGYLEGGQILDLRDADGWFHSGDVGYLDHRGELTVTGRLDNQFISGGENIQPEQIEKALLDLDQVSHAIILPRKDEEFGQRPVAFIAIEGETPSADSIRTALRKTLPGYMLPDDFFLLDPAEFSQGLKLDREYFKGLLNEPNIQLHSLT